MTHNNKTDKLGTGILLLVFGLLFLGINTNVLPWRIRDLFFHGQYLLIFVGLVLLFTKERKFGGILLLTIGVGMLLARSFHLPVPFFRILIPLGLIIGGISLVFRKKNTVQRISKKQREEEELFPKEIYGEDFHKMSNFNKNDD